MRGRDVQLKRKPGEWKVWRGSKCNERKGMTAERSGEMAAFKVRQMEIRMDKG